MTDPALFSATETLAAFRARTLSPGELLAATLARLDRAGPRVNAFAAPNREAAVREAALSTARWARGEPAGLLDGVLFTTKDSVVAAGFARRMGSLVTDATPVTADSPAVARLKEEGAILLGITTMPEFGWKGLSDSPLTGLTRNPWNLDVTTGGSSAGAVAACALGLGALHTGTDGAGSVRIPASFTGVFGLKPSFGRVPAWPASAFTVLSHIGPITRTVADAALMMSVISRPDERDIFAWNTPAPDFRVGLGDGVRGLRLAWSPRLGFVNNLDPEVAAITERAAASFAELGAHVETVEHVMDEPWELIEVLWRAGSAAVGASLPREARARMDPGFVRVIEDGEGLDVPRFLRAFTGRGELVRRMIELHSRFDLLLTPTMPIPAFGFGADMPAGTPATKGSLAWAQWSPYTWPFNLTQQPAASVPCGFTKAGLPVGLQIVGPPRRDGLVLRASRAFESLAHFRMPEVFGSS